MEDVMPTVGWREEVDRWGDSESDGGLPLVESA